MNLANFTENDIKTVIDDVFKEADQFHSVEEAYQALSKKMCKTFFNESGESDLILSRVYHSFDYALLPNPLQETAKEIWKEKVNEKSKMLILLGTYGKESAWQDRKNSKGHKAILLTHETLTQIPMVSRLLQQIGIDLGVLLASSEGDATYEGVSGTFGVFYVSPALGSPYIPAQDFVKKYDVKSVIGTGVMLPQGDVGAYIGFSCVPIENDTAANIASLMSLFWQKAFSLLANRGMFS